MSLIRRQIADCQDQCSSQLPHFVFSVPLPDGHRAKRIVQQFPMQRH